MKNLLLLTVLLPFSARAQMGFTENLGQFTGAGGNTSAILFKSTGTGPQIFVTTSGLTYVFHQEEKPADPETKNTLQWSKIEMQLAGASIRPENIVKEDALPGYSNYYYPHCPQGILHVRTWHKVTIRNIYPGIDWVLTADDRNGMAHDFIVHPGAGPSQVRLLYKGVNGEKIRTDEQGRLVLASAYGTIYEGKLDVYEEATGKHLPAAFVCDGPQVFFKVHPKCGLARQTIVIDPPLLWSMPQASSDFDYGYAITAAQDGSGDVLLTGATDGTDFPTLNAYQGQLYGFEDMVIERLNASGVRIWSTYYGGTDYEQGKGIASDAAGNCYVTGNTGSNDFPVQNPLQANYGNGVYDVAILKFNVTGARQWATWYGSFGNDYGTAIAADASGNVYVTGYTNSQFFLTAGNPIQASKNTGYDAFIMKLSTACAMQWCTFYGGDDDDKARAMTIDASGANIFLTGSTLSGNFPVSGGVFQGSNANAYNAEDAFVVKISAAQVVQFSSYCGGSDADYGQGIAVDNAGNVFVSGYTLSGDFPVADPGGNAYVDSTLASIGTADAFVVECNASGSARTWSTYFGGTAPDMAFAIAADPFVGVYVCGNTASTDFPTQQPADLNFYQSAQGDGGSFNDMFIAWFGTNDSLRWSTYYGDSYGNEAYGICTDALNNIFVTGVDSNELGVLKFAPGVPTGAAPVTLPIAGRGVFPNPASQEVIFRFAASDEGAYTIELLDMQGRVIVKEETSVTKGTAGRMAFDISPWADGVYFLRLSSAEKTEVFRFVKQ